MTEPREVTVSDEEALLFVRRQRALWGEAGMHGVQSTKEALAAFLARRVPDAPHVVGSGPFEAQWVAGAKQLRDKVLKGV